MLPKSPQQAESKTADKGDEVSLNKPPKWAQVLIQQALQFALEINGQHYQAPKSQEFKLDLPETITPETLFDYETVADNVLAVRHRTAGRGPCRRQSRMRIWPR